MLLVFQRLLLILVVSISTVSLSYAADAIRIAVVDPERAMLHCNEGVNFIKKLEQDQLPETTVLKALRDELEQKAKAFVADRETLLPAEKTERETELKSLEEDYQYKLRKLQKSHNQSVQTFLQSMSPKLERVWGDILNEGKYDLILQTSQQPSVARSAVLHAGVELNITNILIERLNKLSDKK